MKTAEPQPEYDPDAGGVGYLTWDEFDRLTKAWVTAIKHLPWWWVAGQIRSGDVDEMHHRSTEPSLPIPATWLAAHEITRLMQELNQWRELEDAAHDDFGAELARLLTKEVETAAAKWPISDRSHKVQHFRCQACQQLTLKYLPPNDHAPADAPKVTVQVRVAEGGVRERAVTDARPVLVGGRTEYEAVTHPLTVRPIIVADVVVRCTDRKCGAVMDSTMFELSAAVIEQEWRMRNAKQRMVTG